MSLLTRINLALGAVFIVAALTAGYACRSILEANAQREVFAEAGLMMDSALAIRDYTANEILPLLSERIQSEFPPQSVPFYAATQNFLRLRARHPEYMYKEATLNPMNPRDRAADWESDIIQRFRSDAHARPATAPPRRRREPFSRATATITASAGRTRKSWVRKSFRCPSPAPRRTRTGRFRHSWFRSRRFSPQYSW